MNIISQYWIWIIMINIILMFGIKYIINFFSKETEEQGSVFKFRLINAAFITLLILGHIFHGDKEIFYLMYMTLLTLYISVLSYELISYVILERTGTKVKIQDKESRRENHNTRIMSLLSLVAIMFVTFIVLIKIWGFDSALETTGFVGIFVGFLAFTAGIWGPDLISGILLLNNKLINDGDTIKIKNKLYIVYKFGFFETVLMNIEKNNRTFIKNSQMRDELIENMDKPASAQGIRQQVIYTIPYQNDKTYEEYFQILETIRLNIQKRFYQLTEYDEYVNNKVDMEFYIENPGNYGIDISIAFYLNRFTDYRSTGTLREVFLSPKSNLHKAALIEFQKKGITLDTPMLIDKVNEKEIKLPTTKYTA